MKIQVAIENSNKTPIFITLPLYLERDMRIFRRPNVENNFFSLVNASSLQHTQFATIQNLIEFARTHITSKNDDIELFSN